MKTFLVTALLLTSGVAIAVFLMLWLERGFDGAWGAFERFAEDVLRED